MTGPVESEAGTDRRRAIPHGGGALAEVPHVPPRALDALPAGRAGSLAP